MDGTKTIQEDVLRLTVLVVDKRMSKIISIRIIGKSLKDM